MPAMDAMRRGQVVLTTPVGQIQEIIKNGENGFICQTKEQFMEKISLLSKDLDLLHRMRIASRDYILSKRSRKNIEERVVTFLQECSGI